MEVHLCLEAFGRSQICLHYANILGRAGVKVSRVCLGTTVFGRGIDASTPVDETLRAMDNLVRQGKVRYIGCSNFDSWQIVEGLWTSKIMNLERFVSNQPAYNLIERSIEQSILLVCRKYGLL